jgi:hypothetical protein
MWQTDSQHENISSKTKNETGCPVPPLLFPVVLEFLAKARRQENKTKEIQKEEIKLLLLP